MIVALYDTNIYISGAFWRGAPRQALHLAQLGVVEVVTCEQVLNELRRVLTRPDKPFCLTSDEADAVIENVLSYARLVTPP